MIERTLDIRSIEDLDGDNGIIDDVDNDQPTFSRQHHVCMSRSVRTPRFWRCVEVRAVVLATPAAVYDGQLIDLRHELRSPSQREKTLKLDRQMGQQVSK